MTCHAVFPLVLGSDLPGWPLIPFRGEATETATQRQRSISARGMGQAVSHVHLGDYAAFVHAQLRKILRIS